MSVSTSLYVSAVTLRDSDRFLGLNLGLARFARGMQAYWVCVEGVPFLVLLTTPPKWTSMLSNHTTGTRDVDRDDDW
jgi:hypothetical protein